MGCPAAATAAPYCEDACLRLILPKGLHRIRHYGLFANRSRAENLARIRVVLEAAPDPGWTPLIRRGVERSITATGINSYRVFKLAGVDPG